MRKKIFIAVGVLGTIVIASVVVVAMQPAEFQVVRSATIAAPAGDVFAQMNDFHHWKAWSPWAKLDPAAKETFEGPTAGTGAIFKWSGNNEVGEGMMMLTESLPNERIRIKLDFIRPFEGTSDVTFTFKSQGNQTVVTWRMAGKNNFISKVFHLCMDMDKTIGGDFDRGLAQMKSVVEAAAKK